MKSKHWESIRSFEITLNRIDTQCWILFSYAEKNNDLKLFHILETMEKQVRKLSSEIWSLKKKEDL